MLRRAGALARAATGVATVVVLLAACGGNVDNGGNLPSGATSSRDSAANPSDDGSASAGTTPVGDGGILPPKASPLAAYLLQGADLYTIQAAEAELSGECMKRFGFDPVDLGLDRDTTVAEQRENDTRIYGITDLAEARAYGYQPESVATGAGTQAPVTSASYNFVYTGDRSGGVPVPQVGQELESPGDFGGLEIPPGGCLGEARNKLWGTPNPDVKDGFSQSMRISAYDAARADPRVQQIFSEWSACMAAQGFNYQSPLEPKFSREPGSTPSGEEINTAVADIECKKKSDLIAAWNKVDVEYQEKAIEDNQLQLSEEQDKIEAGLKNAATVLNGD